MSRIPKYPPALKENRPALSNTRNATRTLVTGLSEADKKTLILNHTRPARNATVAAASVPAPRMKRSATVPAPSAVPNKVAKIEKKVVAPRIPPYDFKARFNDLSEKHKVIKNELCELKDKLVEVSDEYEKVKEAVDSSIAERDMWKEKVTNTMKELRQKSMEYESLKIDLEFKNKENEELQSKAKLLETMTSSLTLKTLELDRLKMEHDKLQMEYKGALELITTSKTDSDAMQNILNTMYTDQRILRNTVQDLKGNIRVYCRVRPPLDFEASKPLYNLNVLDACSIEVEKIELLNSARKGKPQHTFTFDGIFTPHSTQEDVFSEVSQMVQSALDGYNVCIFAYGQTGSGKTYTMEGGSGEDNYGIIPRAINMIFTCIGDLKRMGWDLTIKASFLEIYNEVIYDLLNSCKDQLNHEIKMVNSKGTDLYVSNLKEEEVKSSHDFIRLLLFAQRNRQTAATINNERSSRSHSVAQIKITAINEKRKEKFTSNLNLVDLAGSESGKTTQRMDETKHINRSLSELSKVILSLQNNQSHIPYRNSKLTHLLMPSLGGNSKTLMLVNINQFDECFGETLNSLRFATKVNSCRTVKAKKNLTQYDM
ncbi:protein claret segregational [Bicyclus anynana]|uniref:Protein claret segregational-like n=1 Tax=Bicyclus anynana TaxID=110368 RepID=A0A6J1NTK1_BICAN|nr:protein claret segregational [Bicyclus anynana]XP_023948183.1 protein claret segregational [Bicyclus anynana]